MKKKVPGGKRCLCEGTQEEDDKRFENVKKINVINSTCDLLTRKRDLEIHSKKRERNSVSE